MSQENVLKPFKVEQLSLVANKEDDYIYDNHFIQEGSIFENEDCGGAFKYQLFQCCFPKKSQTILKINNEILVEALTIKVEELTNELLDSVYQDLNSLNDFRYEIWHADHNVKDSIHLPDPTGHSTKLLNLLKSHVDVIEPVVNHNKVSSKPEDRFGLNHFHVDSFEGMRVDLNGDRQKIDRYFFNLDIKERDICIGILDPNLLSNLVPIEYKKDLLKDLIDCANRNLPLLKITTPGFNRETNELCVLKMRTTHVLHGEYGPKGDLLAIVNTLPNE